jgi:hypothetical protein
MSKLAHSKLSASSSERWWNCPGSVKATANCPNTTSVYAAEGNVAHSLAADCLLKDWDYAKLDTFIGVEKAEGEFSIEITEEMIDAVWEYVTVIRSHMRPGAIMYVEKRIEMPEVHELLFATPDCIIVWPYKKVMAFDLKYGKRKVSSYENKQLLYYALRYFIDEDVKEVEISIVQPRFGDDHVSTFSVDARYMDKFREDLRSAALSALLPKAPLFAGDWCQKTFCPLFKSCSTAQKKAQSLVAKDFAEAPAPRELSMEQIVKVLDNAEFLKAWLGKVVDYAKELAYQGEAISGYKLVASYGNRKWSSEDALLADFEGKYGDKMKEPGKLKSPAKMEKVIGKKAVEQYAFKPDKGYKLVPAGAKGEPVSLTNAAEDFKN